MTCSEQNEKLVDFARESMKRDMREFINICGFKPEEEVFAVKLLGRVSKTDYTKRRDYDKRTNTPRQDGRHR